MSWWQKPGLPCSSALRGIEFLYPKLLIYLLDYNTGIFKEL